MHAQSLSHVRHFCDPHQAPLPVEFSRHQCWSGLPFPTPGDLPDPGMEPALAGLFFTTEPGGKPFTELLVFAAYKSTYSLLQLLHVHLETCPLGHLHYIELHEQIQEITAASTILSSF